jgi:hypothetical protein
MDEVVQHVASYTARSPEEPAAEKERGMGKPVRTLTLKKRIAVSGPR